MDVKGAYQRDILENMNFRDLIFKTQEIVIISGIRRCGKSYLMRLIWNLIKNEKKLNGKQYLYINFEDERIIDFKKDDFNLLIESYLELKQPDLKSKIYLFFDEIQNVKNWEKFLNRLREDSTYKIIISGSNATLLSPEISSFLTGRSITVNLYPFTFKEFINARGFKFEMQDSFDLNSKVQIANLFSDYFDIGGFPEVIKTGYRPLLQEYFQNIIFRDIIMRFKIKHEFSLRELAGFLVANIGNNLSIKKIANLVGIKNVTTLKNYLSYLKDSFLFYFIPKYSYSISKQIYNPDKIYIADIGIYNEISFRFSENKGKKLENFVFLEFLKKDYQIYYGYDGLIDIDFIICKNSKIVELAQCCYEIERPETREREIKSLIKALTFYKMKEGSIYTFDFEGEERVEGMLIKYIPAWKLAFEK
ncbi:MAG: ATP-binding protein [Actinobacteria bacterium]|nr:ATP-binding protein [Actinomycetota bacterium]